MPKPPKKIITLKEKIERIRQAQIQEQTSGPQEELLDDVKNNFTLRLQVILNILKPTANKPNTMNFLILYDIKDNKVRTLISKFLENKGCIRIQYSVFLCHSTNKKFTLIHETLKDINSLYENKDSILVIPINVSDVRSMKIIGKNINLESIIDPPNTLFL
jgi:CRISPR-associated endonuclease Cas2